MKLPINIRRKYKSMDNCKQLVLSLFGLIFCLGVYDIHGSQSNAGAAVQAVVIKQVPSLQDLALAEVVDPIWRKIVDGPLKKKDGTIDEVAEAELLTYASNVMQGFGSKVMQNHGRSIGNLMGIFDTALIYSKNQPLVKMFSEHGVYDKSALVYGQAPLIAAISNGWDDITEILLDRGANVHIQDKGLPFIPLMHAIDHGRYKTVESLLDRGASVNSIDLRKSMFDIDSNRRALAGYIQGEESGITAFIYALKYAKYDIAKLLLARGANIEDRRSNGRNALHHMMICDDQKGVEFVLNNGAKVDDFDHYPDIASRD